jgi:transporter family protein
MWIILGIVSSVFLGFHEIVKKTALTHNAVLPVLFLSSASAAMIFVPLLTISRISHEFSTTVGIYIPESSVQAHLMFLLKSVIVGAAWTFGYFSVKHLPVTLLAPLNASGPVWTMLGAIIIYNERMNAMQWTGVVLCLGFYFILSTGGDIREKKESNTHWITFALLSILFNSVSALLDKFLVRQYDRIAMQAWFSVYTALIFLVMAAIMWYPARKRITPFNWRWSLLLIGIFLVIADFFYFKALSFEGSLVSILIIVRRASAILVFLAGALYFKETNLRRRAVVLGGILAGVGLVVVGSL